MSRVVVVGAGPTGLGAGHRLHELGHDDWVVLEASDAVGGLARSCTDEAGFTYDIGGHVLFSHYPYYDDVVDRALDDDYTRVRREALVWLRGRYVPYPFQNNLRHLEPEAVYECVAGLVRAPGVAAEPTTFADWVEAVFGPGIARQFMLPYNFKVWATPPELMAWGWIGERVSVVDIDAVLRNVLLDEDQVDWGPNSSFRYPRQGGTGRLYERIAEPLRDRIRLGCPAVAIDPGARTVTTGDGRRWPYDHLLSTMPLTHLAARTVGAPDAVRRAAGQLRWSGTHVVGIGVDRPTDSTRTWVYYPGPEVPFHRVTHLSRYSPHMTPQPGQTLLLTETSTSAHKPEDGATIVDRVVDGLVHARLLEEADRRRVVSTWRCSPAMTYPVPSLDRDAALAVVESWLDAVGVASRGRFGAWRYEIGNMDHSFMQGVEWVDRVLQGSLERVWTPTRA